MNLPMNPADWSREFLSTVSAHPVLERLFFASVEFAVLVILVWFCIRVARVKSARLVSLLWLVALAKPIVSLGLGSPLPVLTVPVLKEEARKPAETATANDVAAAEPALAVRQPDAGGDFTSERTGRGFPDNDFAFPRNPGDGPLPRSVSTAEFAASPAASPDSAAFSNDSEVALAPAHSHWNAATLVISLWLAGVALFSLRSAVDRLRLRRLIRSALPPDASLSARYTQLAAAIRLRHAPRLKVTDELESPALVGSLVPTVLIPRWLVSEQDRDKIDWALRHELMHWKLFDTYAGLVREVAQALFYFHPAVWWAGRRWEVAAELACDRAIISDDAESRDYAAQLYGMLVGIRDRRRFPVQSGLFATRTQIRQRIAALVQGPCRTRAHLGAVALVAVAAVSLAALSIGGTFAEKERPPDTLATSEETPGLDAPLPDPEASTEPDKMQGDAAVFVRGRVLDPAGKPVAAATVYGIRTVNAEQIEFFPVDVLSQTKSAADGSFSISLAGQPSRILDGSKFVDRNLQVVAIADGYGLDWESIAPEIPNQELTLKLAPDSIPIEGRILSLEGRPVSGVRIRVVEVLDPTTAAVDEWLREVGLNPGRYSEAELEAMSADDDKEIRLLPQFPGGKVLCTDAFAAIPAAVTGRDGRFQIAGLGSDRKVTLALDGESVAKTWLVAVTRQMKAVPIPYDDPRFRGRNYFGASFDYTAEPTQVVAGVVRDADSKQPLADVAVDVYQFAESIVYSRGFLSARTDAQGRYRIVGLPKAARGDRGPISLHIQPASATPYFQTRLDVPRADGLAPVEFDIELKTAVWLTGRVTDKQTGQPVPALVSYYPLLDNPHAREYANFDAGVQGLEHEAQYPTSEDGSYRLPAIHGRGVVMAVALDDQAYRAAAGADEIGWKPRRSSEEPRLAYYIWGPDRANSVCSVHIDAADNAATRDVELIPLESQAIRLYDPDGNALSNVTIGGLFPRPPMFRGYDSNLRSQPICAGDQAIVRGLETDQRRLVLMLHPQRRLGFAGIIEHQRTNDVRLQTCATISGRVVSATGKPAAKTWVSAAVADSEFPASQGQLGWRYMVRSARSDENGRFELDMILPGVRYKIHSSDGATTDVDVVKPGASIDLGSLTATKPDEKSPAESGSADEAPGSAATAPHDPPVNGEKNDVTRIHGRVLSPNGKPAAKACVAVIGSGRQAERGGDPLPYNRVLGEAVCDSDGRYRVQLSGVSSKTQRQVHVIARSDDSGLAWRRIDPDLRDVDVSFDLPAEWVIRGKFIDTEGQPAAGVRIRVSSVLATRQGASGPEGVEYDGLDLPGAWPQPATSDESGRFVMRNLPADHLLSLGIAGTDRFAPLGARLSTAQEQDRQPGDTFRELFKDVKADEETVLVLAPAQIFEGVVRYADSGQPAPHARLTFSGAAAKADAHGHYRINLNSGSRFTMLAFPPDGVPYLGRKLRDITRKAGALVNQVDVTLPRGVFMRGRVVESGTNAPVAGASIQYFPERRNNRNAADDIITGWQGIQLSGTDGAFEIAVLPGPGTLVVDGPRGKYVLQEIGSRQLDSAVPGGERNYAHAIRRVSPDLDSATPDLTIELEHGATVAGRMITTAGEPVEHALILTPLTIGPGEIRWNGWPQEALGGRFELSGLAKGSQYPVYFLDAKNRLGATAILNSEEQTPTVALVPCGQASATFVDRNGKPLQGYFPALDIVVTPGPDRFEAAAQGVGVLAGDAANVVNIDRTNYTNAVLSDANGHIIYPALIPGARYRIITYENGVAINLKEFVAESGKTLELGKIIYEDRTATKSSASNSKTETSGDNALVVHGRVLGPDGKPASKAHVAAIGTRRQGGRGGDLASNSTVLGQAITDNDGRYRMQLAGVSSKTHMTAHVIARTDNSGLAWKRLDPDARNVEASFELPAEQVLRGRLIDIEGLPASNVTLSVKSVVRTKKEGSGIDSGPGYYSFEKAPQAWPPAPVADTTGQFAIHGIPGDHGIYLGVEGNDRIARQGLVINTGSSESRPKNDATYRDLVRNFKPGEEIVLPLAPAQIFEGVVRYADTNEPAPYARLTIWASQQDPAGSMISVPGNADAHGRYRINPYSGVLFGIQAHPPDGVPYLVRQIRDIARKNAAFVMQVDLSLPRGVLVRGRVVEAGTKKPVSGAAIQYIPERFNNSNAKDDIVTGWQATQLAGEEGAFEIAVLPGPGTLVVNGQNAEFVTQEIGSRQLARGLPGGERNYAHAFQRLNPEANAEPLDVTIELQRGATVSGRITTASGEPVQHALLITRLNMHPSELTWRGFPLEALGGKFELAGLADGTEYPVHVLDAKNRLGATLIVRSTEPAPVAVLAPCGDATATFIDNDGNPVANLQPLLEIVLTPGTHRLDFQAMKENLLAADAAYVVNVDRTNYRSAPKTDDNGRVTLPALIPGARYRIHTFTKNRPVVSNEFVAESGKTLDLGKIAVDIPKQE